MPPAVSATTPQEAGLPHATVASSIPIDIAPPSLMVMAQSLWSEIRGVAHDQLELLSLEAQMAGQALARLLMLGAAMGVLLAGTWLCILLVSGLWLWEQGLRASSIVLIAMLINAIALGGLAWAMRRARQGMGFTRSLEALQPGPSPEHRSVTPP